jgi:hypothetical protein
MSTSPQWAPTEPVSGSEPEFDLLVDESTFAGSSVWTGPSDEDAGDGEGATSAPPVGTGHGHTGAHTQASTEYSTSAGTPGRGVIVSAAMASAALAVLDLAMVGRLSFFFDVSFVVICLVAAMAVRSSDLFTAAVLPPLAFAGVIAGVALLWPDAIIASSGLGQTFLTGLAAHAVGLIGGYAAALLTVGARVYARRQ